MAQSSSEFSEEDFIDDLNDREQKSSKDAFQAGRAIRKMQKLAQKIYDTTPGIGECKHASQSDPV